MSTPHSSVLERIDQICDRYEAARLTGHRPHIDDYLREVQEAERSELLRELLRLERDYLQGDQRRRWQQGERVLVQAYVEETPSLRDYPELVFELVCGEVLLRGELGEKPRPADYLDLVSTFQTQLRRFFAARQLLTPVTLHGCSERLTLRATPPPTAVDSHHTVDELPLLDEPTLTQQAAEHPAPDGGTLAPPGYEIVGKLGQGGMGVVYQARQLKADRLVALKMILAGGHAEPNQLARFRTEAEAIARLQHPHVVQVFEVGEHQGLPFFSLEFCSGGSLDKKLAGTPLPPQQAARLVAQLAQGVQAAHDAQVLHRDLKPANVLLAADGTPKVTDFGLAKKLDAQGATITGVIMGTPSYMPPEQARGASQELGPAVDVYALGAILYECLTGRPPFRAATTWDTLHQVLTREPVPPRQLNVQVPRDLETVCLKCLHKEATKRYASAAALADDLGRFVRGAPVLARPVGRLERGVKWVRREPRVAVLLMAVIASLLLGTTVATLFAIRADREAEKERVARGLAEFQALRVENTKHAFQIDQALRAWRQNDLAEAERILSEVAPQFQQTFETQHVRGLCHRKVKPSEGQAKLTKDYPILRRSLEEYSFFLAISHDGRHIFVPNRESIITVWDTKTDQEKRIALPRMMARGRGSISSDAKWVALVGPVKTITICNTESRKVHLTIKGNLGTADQSLIGKGLIGNVRAFNNVAISSDGKWIVSIDEVSLGSDPKATDYKFGVWNAETGEEKSAFTWRSLQPSTIVGYLGLSISSDGKRIIAVNRDWTVQVWDADSGVEKFTFQVGADQGWTSGVYLNNVVISSDGRLIVVGNANGTLTGWDAESGKERFTLQGHHKGQVSSVAISSDGKRIISGGYDGTVGVWDAESGVEKLTLKGHTKPVSGVAISSNGKRIASISLNGTINVWDAESFPGKFILPAHAGGVRGVAISSDGRCIVSSGGTIKVWDAQKGEVKFTRRTLDIMDVAISSNGKHIVAGTKDGAIKVWDTDSGRENLSFVWHKGAVRRVAISSDGKRILAVSQDGTRTVWDVHSGWEQFSLQGPTNPFYYDKLYFSEEFSSEESRIIGVQRQFGRSEYIPESTLTVWDAENGEEKFTLRGHHSGKVSSLAISSDGKRIVLGGGDGTIRLLDADTGVEKLTLKGHTGQISVVAISSNGKHIVAGTMAGVIKVWDTDSGREKLSFVWHTGAALGVAISSDGKRILADALGNEGAVRTFTVWDTETGQEKLTINNMRIYAISSDWNRIVEGHEDGTITIWDLERD
jgi:WD40 repeat protein